MRSSFSFVILVIALLCAASPSSASSALSQETPSDDTAMVTPPHLRYIYYAENFFDNDSKQFFGAVNRWDIYEGKNETIFAYEPEGIAAVAADNNTVFYVTINASNCLLRAVDQDGSNNRTLINLSALGTYEVDYLRAINGSLYWSEGNIVGCGCVRSSSYQGYGMQSVLNHITYGGGVSVVHTNGSDYIYAANQPQSPTVIYGQSGTANPSGIGLGNYGPAAVDIDTQTGVLYGGGLDGILSCGLDGSDKTVVISSSDVDDPQNLLVSTLDGRMYWNDLTQQYFSAALDGGGASAMFTAKSSLAKGMALSAT
eukprot:TRINITY_DN3932_c0_g1_i3.p1 TRINITY_DN3932_c0_g1~~TRINITY_DN3932_c0_g1_i3.p1  ORF type:complete len:360 (-),score=69.86 TRINITY_DN3932_c0_g1_i3:62-1000(-)